MATGRDFIHEHPLSATSWATECMAKLLESPAVYTAEAHMCAYGMQSKHKHAPVYAKNPTIFLTTSIVSARALSRRCPENHRRVHLMEGRARAAAVYPQELCRTICRATLEQAKADARYLVFIQYLDGSEDDHVNEVAFEEPQCKSYWDDLTGQELNRSMVEAARAEELAVVKKMQVWRKVRKEECFHATGRPPIKLRWVDIKLRVRTIFQWRHNTNGFQMIPMSNS